MLLQNLSVGPLQCNCSILACEKSQEAIIIDPGAEADRILQILRAKGWKPKFLLHTHAHFDHIGATDELYQHLGGEVCLHREDLFLYENVATQTSLFGMPGFSVPAIQSFLEDKDTLRFGEYRVEILHTPGHSPGSISFYIPTEKEDWLFTGDTLFQGSIGRTDLWGGDYGQIIRSIKNRLLAFDDKTVVYTGHGPETTIGEEKLHNPFLNGVY